MESRLAFPPHSPLSPCLHILSHFSHFCIFFFYFFGCMGTHCRQEVIQMNVSLLRKMHKENAKDIMMI